MRFARIADVAGPSRPIRAVRLGLVLLATAAVLGGCSKDSTGPEEIAYVAGETYFGRNNYIEYIAGDLPIILSAPHGGYGVPSEIPDRTWGTLGRDRNTQELARQIYEAVRLSTGGGHTHIVINKLARIKLDANREVIEAAQGSQLAVDAWEDYHDFIERSKELVEESFGSGLYIDLHGHGHRIDRLELGYLLSSAELELSDDALNSGDYAAESSIATLSTMADASFAQILRGPNSLGTLLQIRGFPAVPSQAQPDPGGEAYFTGGYNTARHGSRYGGPISGVQIECHWTGLRDEEANREQFATMLAASLEVLLSTHFELEIGVPIAR
jgi:N-formylglutamate amidohydrolase